MADPTKPIPSPVSGVGSTSPLSPQIKVPPSQPLQPPEGLPIKPLPTTTPPTIVRPKPAPPPIPPTVPPTQPKPAFSIPSAPVTQSNKPSVPLTPLKTEIPTFLPTPTKPTSPVVPPIISPKPTSQSVPPSLSGTVKPPQTPVPTLTPPIAQQSELSGQSTFKSSIRTMKEDIEALKKGQTPSGFELEKQMQKELGAAPVIPSPKIMPPPMKATEVELGKSEKSKPMAMSPNPFIHSSAPSAPAFTPSSSSIKIPPEKPESMNIIKRTIFPEIKSGTVIAIIVLIIASVAIWFFFLRGPSTPPITTYTPRPSTAPKTPLIEAFFTVSSVNLDVSGSDALIKLTSSTDKKNLATKTPQLYKISQPLTTGNQRYSFSSFLSKTGVSTPANVSVNNILAPFVEDTNFYPTIFLKTNNTYGYGFIVKLTNLSGIDSALQNWETGLPNNLKNLFGLDVTKAASTTFLDNTYQGAAIRYMNFPGPDKTIDFTLITLSDGEKYLVVTNSKEHMYAIINRVMAGTPTPTPTTKPTPSITVLP